MKNILPFILISALSFHTLANEVKRPCQPEENNRALLKSLEGVDCKLASSIVKDNSELQALYENGINKNLSKKLAKNAAETIEDIALIDSYFDQNGIDLSGHEEIKKYCKLDEIAEPGCGNNFSQKLKNERLALILKNEEILPKGKNTSHLNSLKWRLVNKADSIRNAESTEKKSCPIQGSSGDFILNSSFTLADAKVIIEFSKSDAVAIDTKKLSKFPQFKLISKRKDLIQELEKLIKNYKPSDGDEKTYIDNFFKRSDIQAQLGNTLADKCKAIKNSLTQFVCRPEKPIPLLNEADRFDLFAEGESEDDLLAGEIGRGLSCKYEEQLSKTDNNKENPLLRTSSVSQMISRIVPDLRDPVLPKVFERNNKMFCDLYTCQDDSSRSFNSCKSGGPINSYDLLKTCKGNEAISCEKISDKLQRDNCFNNGMIKCSGDQQKYLSYIKMRERDAINANNIPRSLAGIESSSDSDSGGSSGDTSSTAKKARGYSTFFQNFLGVEGTLIAEGKKPTAAAIADKVEDFKARNIDPSISGLGMNERSSKVALGSDISNNAGGQTVLGPQGPQVPQADGQTISGQGQVDTSDASRRAREELQSSLIAAYSKPVRTPDAVTPDAKAKKGFVPRVDSDSSDDDTAIKGMRDQLDNILGSIKSLPPGEQLKTIAANNQSITGGGSSSSADELRNRAEQERLDRYRDRLKNWDQELNSWSNELRRKESSASWGSPIAANAPVWGNGINPKASPAQTYPDGVSGNGLKLTTANGAGANGLKVDGAKGALGGAKAGGIAGEDDGAIVASDKLSELREDGLNKLGVKTKDSFIIRVRHLDKVYAIPVKSLVHEGKSMFVPLLSEETKNLAKIVMESPLFANYREYQSKLKL